MSNVIATTAPESTLDRSTNKDANRSIPVSSPILRLESITLSFDGVTAVADFDLAVNSGEIRAIIGPNGAGKSSLLNVISGIYRPQRGNVWIDGRKFAQVPTQQLPRLGIARTFQNLALFKGLSVLENVVIGRAAVRHANFVEQIVGLGRARREREDAQARAEEIIDFLAAERSCRGAEECPRRFL
jgi:branched-chain amino acid transport system ATP-binding protein